MQAEIAALSQQINQLKGQLRVVLGSQRELDEDIWLCEEWGREREGLMLREIQLEKEQDRIEDALDEREERRQELVEESRWFNQFTHLFSVRAGGFTGYFGNTRMGLL
jgi:hypothetical protein